MLGTWLTHRYLLKNIGSRWLLLDVGIPLVLTSIGGAFILYLSRGSVGPNYLETGVRGRGSSTSTHRGFNNTTAKSASLSTSP